MVVYRLNYLLLLWAALLGGLVVIGGCANQQSRKNYPVSFKKPSVDIPDPTISFWRDQVHYPFVVQYAKAKDSKGIEWEVAYMDEFAGPDADKAQSQVVVLVHGRGVNAGYWAEVMSELLKSGKRVVALDIPHYGKSIPGNLDKPLTRTLDQVREVFHSIIVDQLGIKKASYLGHSLGGQVVLGLAVRYPENVEKVILESTGGLEAYNPSGLFNLNQKDDFKQWENAWQKLGLVENELGRTEDTIAKDYYFQGDGRAPGYFLKDGEIPRYITRVRQAMIKGKQQEYQRYATMYIREIYTTGIECVKNIEGNLQKRLGEIKAPVLLIMGEKDPFFPLSRLTSNRDVRTDMIKPFYELLDEKGNPPIVKMYKDVGHFPHTDNLAQFSKDVLLFLEGQKIADIEDVESYEKAVAKHIEPPTDVQKFFDDYEKTLLSQDMDKIAKYFADDYLASGMAKDNVMAVIKQNIQYILKFKVDLTEYVPEGGERVVLAGIIDYGSIKQPILDGGMIIKRNGNWLWFGNQK